MAQDDAPSVDASESTGDSRLVEAAVPPLAALMLGVVGAVSANAAVWIGFGPAVHARSPDSQERMR